MVAFFWLKDNLENRKKVIKVLVNLERVKGHADKLALLGVPMVEDLIEKFLSGPGEEFCDFLSAVQALGTPILFGGFHEKFITFESFQCCKNLVQSSVLAIANLAKNFLGQCNKLGTAPYLPWEHTLAATMINVFI